MREYIIKIVRKVLPTMCFQRLWAWYVEHNKLYDEERYRYIYSMPRGKNKQKYFVLRYEAPGFGIFAVARNIILACEWIEKYKYIPVVDFEWNCYYKKYLMGYENCWEYIFENKVSTQDICKEKNVLVGEIDVRYSDKYLRKKIVGNERKDLITFENVNWREYYKKINIYSEKWWRLRGDVQIKYQKTYERLFEKHMRIMGVALREEFSMKKGEITSESLDRHPHQANVDEMISVIKHYMSKWECTHVFVTTYIKDSVEKLRKEFGDKLIVTDRRRVDYDKWKEARKIFEKYLNEENSEELEQWIKEDDEYAQIMNTNKKEVLIEYVEEIYGLSRCDYLLAGKSGGSLAACIWNGGKYKDIRIMEDINNSSIY